MSTAGLLDGDQIFTLLAEVAAVLEGGDGPRHEAIVVGGSLLAIHHMREATIDVDSVRRLDAELRHAAEVVGERHGLGAHWLNDSASAFTPAGFNPSECEVLFEHRRFVVLGAPLRDVFIMKLYRADPADVDDMVAIWPHIAHGFTNATEVAAAFYDAYPHAPDDEHLPEWISKAICSRTAHPLPVH